MRFMARIGAYFALMSNQLPLDRGEAVRPPRPAAPRTRSGPQPLAAARQVVPRDPALRRAPLPAARRRVVVIYAWFASCSRAATRAGIEYVEGVMRWQHTRHRVRVRARDRRVPAVPARAVVARDGNRVTDPDRPRRLPGRSVARDGIETRSRVLLATVACCSPSRRAPPPLRRPTRPATSRRSRPPAARPSASTRPARRAWSRCSP